MNNYQLESQYKRLVHKGSAHALYNKHGAALCHALGCRKHKQLIEGYDGLFCKVHLRQLTLIRDKIQYYKELSSLDEADVKAEIQYRKMEQMLRKIQCQGHVDYINALVETVY